MAQLGMAGQGTAGYGRQGAVSSGLLCCGEFWHRLAGKVCLGMARQVSAGLGMVWQAIRQKGEIMVYKWKIEGVVSADAQTAGEEFDRLYQENGRLLPQDVVDASRESNAPLHNCFEWDDAIAAEKYRCNQAADMIRLIVVHEEEQSVKPSNVRAFVHIRDSYNPISVVLNSEEQMNELLQSALRELSAFKAKYNSLSKLRPVFDAIEAVS